MNYKESVIQKIENNFTTTIIGALECFESEFQDLMENEEFRVRFQEARKKLLDKGNNQRRRSTKMLNRAEISEPRQDAVFKVVDDGNKLAKLLRNNR